jgi:hypothetical protein
MMPRSPGRFAPRWNPRRRCVAGRADSSLVSLSELAHKTRAHSGESENIAVPISSRPRKPPASFAALALLATLGGCDLDWAKPDVSAPPPARFREAKPASAPSLGSAREFTAKFG